MKCAALSLVALLILTPILWLFVSSLKTTPEIIARPPVWLPGVPQWRNYMRVFAEIPMLGYYLNSFLIAGSVSLFVLFTSSLSGYALSKFKFPGRDLIFKGILATMMIPSILFIIPMYYLMLRMPLAGGNDFAGLGGSGFLHSHWVYGNTGSAPGYIFPGVDQKAYAPALAFFKKHGYLVDHEPVSMYGPIVDFDEDKYRQEAYAAGQEVVIEKLSPERVPQFLAFMAGHFKGDWNAAARFKLGTGRLHEILIAVLNNEVVGYCQWEGEHFGPFGVRADIRSKKIGAKLFFEAVVKIRQADGRNVWFNWADEGAARFYQRFGLKETRKFAILKKDF